MFNPVPFLMYIFLMAYTPGPNNIMSMNNAREHGFKKSFPFNLGIFLGIFMVMELCALFGGMLYSFIPQVKLYMTVACAGYMLWLAWSLLRPSREKDAGGSVAQGFWAGALLQFINVKLYIYGVTAISSYILPHFGGWAALSGFAALLAFVGFTGTICWALFGVWLNRLFKSHSRVINGVMAALLCYCAVSLFL